MAPVSVRASGPARFAACTAAVFALMLVPGVLAIACHVASLPLTIRDVLIAASISAAVVGSRCLYSQLFDGA